MTSMHVTYGITSVQVPYAGTPIHGNAVPYGGNSVHGALWRQPYVHFLRSFAGPSCTCPGGTHPLGMPQSTCSVEGRHRTPSHEIVAWSVGQHSALALNPIAQDARPDPLEHRYEL